MKSILENPNWRKFNGTKITNPIYDEVERILVAEAAAGNKIKVCIGTDSQRYVDEFEFATVILFLRKGKGGFMLVHNDRLKALPKIKERMLMEVTRSIEIAYHLCELFEKHNTELEVHADINTNPRFASNTSLSEAMGYILSMGFSFKAKPEALAASCCANKAV
jgi:predicted RNase H-related nuclease YkuK (DUF458 family)